MLTSAIVTIQCDNIRTKCDNTHVVTITVSIEHQQHKDTSIGMQAAGEHLPA